MKPGIFSNSCNDEIAWSELETLHFSRLRTARRGKQNQSEEIKEQEASIQILD